MQAFSIVSSGIALSVEMIELSGEEHDGISDVSKGDWRSM